SATHQDLPRAIEQGTFRHDLFFRLNGFQIQLPPLRERGDDVIELADHFLTLIEPGHASLPEETIKVLKSRSWPGNVRELRHALEHACIVARGGALLPGHFPPPAAQPLAADTAAQVAALVRRWVRERVTAAGSGEPANLYEELLNVTE